MVARQLSGLGGRFEVLSPPSVRRHLADIGRTLLEQYGAVADASASPASVSAGSPSSVSPSPGSDG